MKVVIQTVKFADVLINGKERNSIGKGLLILVGFTAGDTEEKLDKMVYKLTGLRIFEDQNDKINLSIKDIDGEMLVISNFTLYGEFNKGFRPSFINALEPVEANKLYLKFLEKLETALPNKIKCGKFGADMEVSLCNIGPKTLVYEI